MSDSDSTVSEGMAFSSYEFGSAICDICSTHGIRYDSIWGFHNNVAMTCKGEPFIEHCNDSFSDKYCNQWLMMYSMNRERIGHWLEVGIYHGPAMYDEDEDDGIFPNHTPCTIKIEVFASDEFKHVLRGVFPKGARSVKFVGMEEDARDALELIRKIVVAVAENRDFIVKVRARKIQNAWRRAIGCPDYMLCRRRLLREFDDMVCMLRAWYVQTLDLRP